LPGSLKELSPGAGHGEAALQKRWSHANSTKLASVPPDSKRARLLPADAESVSELIAEIKMLWTRGAASTLELARAVSAAKTRSRSRHGHWKQIWSALPFSRRKADMLAAIRQRFATLHSETFELLPRSWNTLYVLAQLDWAVFERFLAAGDIFPGLTLREARELLARSEGRQAPVKSRVRQRLRRFGEFLRATVAQWHADEWELALTEFSNWAELTRQTRTASEISLARNGASRISLIENSLLTDSENHP